VSGSSTYLREVAHLRPRTNLIGAVARVRHTLAQALHRFFDGAWPPSDKCPGLPPSRSLPRWSPGSQSSDPGPGKVAHLRPRTNLIGAVARVRHTLAQALHRFFDEQGLKSTLP
jgi:aspartyl/asparaginyl-tRNA synthetase